MGELLNRLVFVKFLLLSTTFLVLLSLSVASSSIFPVQLWELAAECILKPAVKFLQAF